MAKLAGSPKYGFHARALGIVVLFLVLVVQLSYFLTPALTQSSPPFILIDYNVKSSAGTSYIYPGSRNAVLTASILYNGTSLVNVNTVCINLPEGFTPTRGYTRCAQPTSPSGESVHIIRQGEVFTVEYHIDVSSNVTPGSYPASLVVYYTSSEGSFTDVVEGIIIQVSSYPDIALEVVNWYWYPAGYPGSEGVYLYITIRNASNATIVEASGSLVLPDTVFTPSKANFQLANLGVNELATVSVGTISISTTAVPGYPYQCILDVNATMRTDDGVTYYKHGVTYFNVAVSQPPSVLLYIVDYGLESPKHVSGLKLSRFYATFVNKDFRTIRTVVARFTIVGQNATFADGSDTSTVVSTTPVQYGGSFTLVSSPLVINDTRVLRILLQLEVFGDENGAEFWSSISYTLEVLLSEPSINIDVPAIYWSQQCVYPGTEGATLNIVVRNNDVVAVRSAIAIVELPPSVFYPSKLVVSDVAIQRGSMTTISFTGINVNATAPAGNYTVILSLKGVAYDASTGAYYNFEQKLVLLVEVSEKPEARVLEAVAYGWVGNVAYTTSAGVSMYAYLQVKQSGYTVVNPVAIVYLPHQMVLEGGSRNTTITISGSYHYGSWISINVRGINIATDLEGEYPVVIKVCGLATVGNSEYWFCEYHATLLEVKKPVLNISVVDYSWSSSPVSPSSRGASLRIMLQSLALDTVKSLVAVLELHNAVFASGESRAVVALNTAVDYGAIVSLEFSDIELSNVEKINATLSLVAVLAMQEGYYRAVVTYGLSLSTRKSISTFEVVAVHTRTGAGYAPLLPSSRGVTVQVELANVQPYAVAWVKPIVEVPSIIKLNDVSGTCTRGISPGGVCTVDLSIDVSPDAEPGTYTLILKLQYAVTSNGAISLFEEVHEVPIAISSYSYYKPSISLVSTYWGTQVPTRATVQERNVPLTVVVANTGYYAVEAVYVSVKPVHEFIGLVKASDACSPYLDPGSFCTVVLYLDLANVTSALVVRAYVNVTYAFTIYNARVLDYAVFEVELPVEEAASGKGLRLVSVQWLNNWPVYPQTENATLVVQLANMWPYAVSGLSLELHLPEGFYAKSGSTVEAYVAGPINSMGTTTVSFTISVGNVTPGLYLAKLVAKYVVQSGEPWLQVEECFNVSIVVNDPSTSITLLTALWVGEAPQPPEYGAIYAVAFRNNFVPSMKGVVLELELPEGIYSADTNTSRLVAVATKVSVVNQLGLPQRLAQTPAELVQAILQGSVQQGIQASPEFAPGDVIYFYLRLNLLVNKPGTYVAYGYLSFVDHWGSLRKQPVSVSIAVLGSSKIVELYYPQVVRVVSGVVNLTLGLKNTGSAPLYDVYVYLVPQAPLLLPSEAVKYVSTLPTDIPIYLNYTLVYNPLAVAAGAAQMYVRYTSAVFTVTLVYSDVHGYRHVFNTTMALLIEPFVELVLSDVKATLANGVLSISGVVSNYGIATARSVVVKASYGGVSKDSLVGDLDPAAQVAFRVEIQVPSTTTKSSSVLVEVEYRDEYGRVGVLSREVPVLVVAAETTTAQAPRQQLELAHYWLVVLAVAVFLALVAFFIYRYLKLQSKTLKAQ